MAQEINAGRVAMVVKGDWSNTTTYSKLDVVTYDNSSWVCIADNTAQTPSSGSTYWQMLAGGVEKMIVTVTPAIGVYQKDKTYAELLAAYNAGQNVSAVFEGAIVPLVTVGNNTLTFITTINDKTCTIAINSSDQVTVTVVGLQTELVSGTSIKTVNSESLLGSGNIAINGVYVVTMTQQNGGGYTADKSVSEIYAARYTNDKVVVALMQDEMNIPVLLLTECNLDGDAVTFSASVTNNVITLTWTADDDYSYEYQEFVLQQHLTFDNAPTANSNNPVKSGGIKTAIDGKKGVSDASAPSTADGTWTLTLDNGDTITLDLNHTHPQYGSTGATADRPTLASGDVGYQYFDTTLGKYICWDGSAWINLDGTSL